MELKRIWIIEKGNSRWKIGEFIDDILINVTTTNVGVELTDVNLPKEDSKRIDILITGSGDWNDDTLELLKSKGNVTQLRHGDSHPLITNVTNPGSLGTDRVANAYAIQKGVIDEVRHCHAWLVVDVGTCVTFDLLVDGIHLGGAIAPGISMRLDSMKIGTAALQEVKKDVWDKKAPFNGETTGLSTEEALIKGAADGISAEIIGRWQVLRERYGSIGVILTGGDCVFLELGRVKPKFADLNLTLKGYYALFPHI
jgi:type III pantothenate kinase